jgi:RNA polymerase sigma-70 factor (sigma-E family)
MEFEEYAAARWPVLFRTALLLTGDRAEAEDLAQTTLVKVFASWSKVRRAESPDAYVRRMLVNELTSDRRRSARRAARRPLAALGPGDLLPADDPSQRLDLWTHVLALPPRQRAVLVLRFYEDLTEVETARVLGVSVGTVKSQAHDALRTLRTRLSQQEVPS